MVRATEPVVQDWTWLRQQLQRGVDGVERVREFVQGGGTPGALIPWTLGDREGGVSPCPRSLEFLLQARADPNAEDGESGSPLLHVAAWRGTVEVVDLLLAHGAKLEIGEEGTKIPPLNTALAAGNVPVALALLERRADATWRHEDGAGPLHVVASWICDDERATRRRPPTGEEPLRLVRALLQSGADPTHDQRGASGRTAMAVLQQRMHASPWSRDEESGADFLRTVASVQTLLVGADEAMRLKALGNTAFKEGRHEDALAAWRSARARLGSQQIAGHHLAVLRCNEAIVLRRLGDLDGCREACSAGLAESLCAPATRAKLEHHLASCRDTAATGKAPEADGGAAAAATDPPSAPPATAASSVTPAAPATASGTTTSSPSTSAPERAPTQRRSQLRSGFLQEIGESSKPMYGAEGSKQGKNHSDLVWVPAHGQMVQVPYGKVMPIAVPHPKDTEGDDEEA